MTGVVDQNEGDMSYLARQYGVEPTVISQLSRNIHWWDDLIALRKLIQIIRLFKPDILHTHTAKAGTLGRIAAMVTRVPIRIHTFHGHVFHGYFNSFISHVFILIERFLSHFSSRIIAISAGQKRELTEQYRIAKPHQVSIIPLGLDIHSLLSLDVDSFGDKSFFNIPKNNKVVSIVGRLVPIKNHTLFLKVAQRLLQEYGTGIRFLVVGDGECRESLLRQAESMHISEYIRFVGWQLNVDRVYAASDVIVLTSLNEGTPVSLIEAMAAARPVVATNVGGVVDVVSHGRTGFLVPSNDPIAMSERVMILLNDEKLRRRFGKNGRRLVKEKYSLERLVGEMSDLYTELFDRYHG